MKTTIIILLFMCTGAGLFAQTTPASTTTTVTNGTVSTTPPATTVVSATTQPPVNNMIVVNSITTPVVINGVNYPVGSMPPAGTVLKTATVINGISYPAGTVINSTQTANGTIPASETANPYPLNTVRNPAITNEPVSSIGSTNSTTPVRVSAENAANTAASVSGSTTETTITPAETANPYPLNTVRNPAITNEPVSSVGSTNPTMPVRTSAENAANAAASVNGSKETTSPATPTVSGEVPTEVAVTVAPASPVTTAETPENRTDSRESTANAVNKTAEYMPLSNVTVNSMNYTESMMTGLTRYAAVPVHSTYVPDEIALMLKNKYGSRLYDITRVKASAESDQYKYIVRLQNNGVFDSESVDEQGMAMR